MNGDAFRWPNRDYATARAQAEASLLNASKAKDTLLREDLTSAQRDRLREAIAIDIATAAACATFSLEEAVRCLRISS